jgi:hypothetical protein
LRKSLASVLAHPDGEPNFFPLMVNEALKSARPATGNDRLGHRPINGIPKSVCG